MTNAAITSKFTRIRGMTLVEIMVALGIAAVLLALAAPNFNGFLNGNRLTGVSNDLLRSLQTARNEAIKRQLPGPQSVIVCASNNPTAATPTCSYGQFSGWIVFADQDADGQFTAGEPLIEQHSTVDPSVSVRSDRSGLVSYNVTGFSNPAVGALNGTRNIVICDSRGVTAVSGAATSNARAIIVRATGRARVSNLQTEASAAITAIGGSCP